VPESRNTKDFWTPAFAGVTGWATFYEFVKSAFAKKRKGGEGVLFGFKLYPDASVIR
jgi:hypothetical protein